MTFYRRVGDVPRKRHQRFRPDGGALHPEELMGQEGFSGSSSLLYHRHSPSAIVSIEPVDAPLVELTPNLPVRPLHLRPSKLEDAATGDLVTSRHVLIGNDDVRVSYVRATTASPLYRNGAGDELVYVQQGRAVLESVFGSMTVERGDYVVIPTSTTHRWLVTEAVEALVFEAAGHVRIPERYLTHTGQLLEGAPYSERDLRGPESPLLIEEENVPVVVRTAVGLSRHVHANHPFDVVGWDGCLYPFAFSIHDFEPIVGRVHQPPPVHQTFAGPSFVVCSFVPRPYDFDPEAVKVPYHHANVDSDEMLFYSAGEFMSREGAGIAGGSITVHPAGFVHGPQPGAVERSMNATRTEELAVMLDTFRPMRLSPAARAISDPDYAWTWKT